MDRNEIYTGKARLVNRGNGIVLRCATKGELAELLALLRALFPAWGTHEGSHGEGCGMSDVQQQDFDMIHAKLSQWREDPGVEGFACILIARRSKKSLADI
ncbi:MAG: hypothetical protein ACLRWP_07920 [Bilophila wadsworthia]